MSKQSRVIVLTTEPPPLPGLASTGAGLRAWGLAQGLRSAGHDDVTIVFTAEALAAQGKQLPEVPKGCPKVVPVPRKNLAEWLRDARPDVLVAQHWGILRDAGDVACPLAIDMHGPHLLERLLWGSPDPAADRREKLRALARADHLVCAGPSQRHYFIPFLVEAGYEPSSDVCPVVPFSFSPSLPTPAPDRDASTFAFGGFFLPWQDPEKPIRWLLEECEARGKGRLEFFGGMHPTMDVSRGRFGALAEMLHKNARVVRHGIVPHDDMVLALRKCGVALDLMTSNLERELAFTSRTVIYLWAGVPAIHNNYDDLAALIDQYRAGWTLDPGDEEEFKRLVARLLSHPEDVQRRAEGARQLVRERLTWDRTIEPLSRWTLDPRPRKGRRAAAEPVKAGLEKGPAASGRASATEGAADSDELRRARREIERLKGETETLRSSKVVQIGRRARGLSPILAPIAFVLAAFFAAMLFVLFTIGDAVARLSGSRPTAAPRRRSGPKRT